jgi:IclR family transcriptional regulator, acetate operon repressor
MQIKVLDKAVEVMELLANSDGGIRLRDVTEALLLNKTTALRILRVLESHNLTARSGDATFVLGNRVLWWETCYRRNFDLLAVVRPHLEKLRGLTSETAIFSIMADFRTVIVNQAVSHHVTSSRYDLGAVAPLHAGASGKVMLAFLDFENQKKFLSQYRLDRLTPRTITDRKQLERQLKEIRTRGVAVTRGERLPNTTSVAVPVFGTKGEVLGALAVIGPSERLTDARLRKIAPMLMGEAGLLTEQINGVTAGSQKMNGKKNLSTPVGKGERSQIVSLAKRARSKPL